MKQVVFSLIVLIVLAQCSMANAQEATTDAQNPSSSVQDTSARTEGIRYLFTPDVEKAVADMITKATQDSSDRFYLIFYTDKHSRILSLHDLDSAPEGVAHYVNVSNRYMAVEGRKITIVLWEDLDYGVWENDKGMLIRTHILDGGAEVRFDELGRLQR